MRRDFDGDCLSGSLSTAARKLERGGVGERRLNSARPLAPDTGELQFILTRSEPRDMHAGFCLPAPFLAAGNYLTHLCIAIINFLFLYI